MYAYGLLNNREGEREKDEEDENGDKSHYLMISI